MSIEKQIQDKGLNAPRVTMDDIEKNIAGEYFFTAADGYAGEVAVSGKLEDMPMDEDGVPLVIPPEPLDLLTFCVLVLKNGFTVTGEYACASPENFDAEIGKKIAREHALSKVWPLMGYALKQSLAE